MKHMKKLFTLTLSALLSVALFAQPISQMKEVTTTSGDSYIPILDNATQLNRKIKMSNAAMVVSGTYLIQGANTYTANTSITNTGTFGVKSTGAIKFLTGGTGSIFSYKRSSTDSTYLLFQNSSNNTATAIRAIAPDGSSALTLTGRNEKLAAITSSGIINSSTFQIDTISQLSTSSYASFAGIRYNADYSANFTARSLIDSGFAAATFAPISASSLTLEQVLANGRNVDVTGTIKSNGGSTQIDINNQELIGNGSDANLDWGAKTLMDALTVTLNWGTFELKDASPTTTLNWNTKTLSSNWTATTQTANDNSTKLATTAYVDNIGGAGYKDSTSVRAFATNYLNNTGQTKLVTASFDLETLDLSSAQVEILVNGVVVATVRAITAALSSGQNIYESVSFFVPNDVNYRFNATNTGGGSSTIISVFEMKL